MLNKEPRTQNKSFIDKADKGRKGLQKNKRLQLYIVSPKAYNIQLKDIGISYRTVRDSNV